MTNETTLDTIENCPITLNLDLQSVNLIMQALGDLPSRTGALNLMLEIKQQGDPQIPATSENTPNPEK